MARSLEELQKQYNSGSKHESLRGGPGSGHGPGGPRGRLGGKPKNLKKTVKRILGYLKEYRLRLALVFLCMFFTTVATLFGGYMIAPIINRITLVVKPDANLSPSSVERFADRFYGNADSQYLTIVASKETGEVTVHEGIEYFDSYQHEHKGDEV